jgi:hypothetical protein
MRHQLHERRHQDRVAASRPVAVLTDAIHGRGFAAQPAAFVFEPKA